MDTNVNRATPQGSAATSQSSPDRQKTTQTAQTIKRAVPSPSDIAQRAYDLYEQGGRQDGRALEDWFNAEHQLADAAGK